MMKNAREILRANSVVKSFRVGRDTVNVLRGITLGVRDSEVLVVVGKSGAGKTTLLQILGWIERPTSGHVSVDSALLERLPGADINTVRNRLFGFVFQLYHLFPELNVLENTLVPAMVGHSLLGWLASRKDLRRRALMLLGRVGLSERLQHRPSELSGGERQRVAIARALMNDPEILFCDEPTGNLDIVTGTAVIEMLLEINNERKKTLVIVTHDESLITIGSRVVRIADGLLVDSAPARE
jgi:ABC-type lipoprotein export system ATPase subunit